MLQNVLPEVGDRHEEYRRNDKLEYLISELNELLQPVQAHVLKNYKQPGLPVIFVVGPPRSGSTLLMQWLASSGHFGYISNFISRFFTTPSLGAKIQKMLFNPEYSFLNEMEGFEHQNNPNFTSDLGKTRGPLGVNEFWYFWRRFFKSGANHSFNEDELSGVDLRPFLADLAALEHEFKKPLILKALMLNWNLLYLEKHIRTARFIHIKRDPFFNAYSLLKTRLKFYGTIEKWYSFKPPEYDQLIKSDPYFQVAGQVYYTNKAILQQFKDIPASKSALIGYEDFCKNPQNSWETLVSRFNLKSTLSGLDYQGPKTFRISNRIMEDSAIDDERLRQAVESFY